MSTCPSSCFCSNHMQPARMEALTTPFTPYFPTIYYREGLPTMDRRGLRPRGLKAVASFISVLLLLVACADAFRFPFPTARTASR